MKNIPVRLVMPKSWVPAAPNRAPAVIRPRGATASDNIPIGTENPDEPRIYGSASICGIREKQTYQNAASPSASSQEGIGDYYKRKAPAGGHHRGRVWNV